MTIAKANEIVELTPTKVEELEEHKGYLYQKESVFTSKIMSKCYYFDDDDTYGVITELDDCDYGTTLYLQTTNEERLPKYWLEFVRHSKNNKHSFQENFFFETFEDLNHFLETNPFYKLITKQI